jgi:hypothetical protein
VWKGFDTTLLDDGMVTWQEIGATLLDSPGVLVCLLALPLVALAVHFLL